VLRIARARGTEWVSVRVCDQNGENYHAIRVDGEKLAKFKKVSGFE